MPNFDGQSQEKRLLFPLLERAAARGKRSGSGRVRGTAGAHTLRAG